MPEESTSSVSPGVPGYLRIPLSAHLAERYGAETREALEDLAVELETALPERTTITRRGGWLSRKKTLERIEVELGDLVFVIEVPESKQPPRPLRRRVVRGIVLATDSLTMPEWLEELAGALEQHASQNAGAKAALERWLR